MIDIIAKKDCVGCQACVQRCPKDCISFNEDEQGFRYPKVNPALCIRCNLCEKVCPVIHQASPHIPKSVYAAKNNDEYVRKHSSSGGIFYALAEYVIKRDGVVVGAKFNTEWEVVHGYAEDIEGVKAFQKSKYVQSYIGETFSQAETFLNHGRLVLFSGTPCQIAGLKLFLKKDYGEKLITVDFVCHGVPSPRVWRDYLKFLLHPQDVAGQNSDFQSTLNEKLRSIMSIDFRDKRLDWAKYGFSVHAVARKGDQNTDFQSRYEHQEIEEILFEPHYKNLFMQGFLKDLYLRPSCYDCPAKSGKSHSDITLADFWGIQRFYPDYYEQGYISLILAKTQFGKSLLESINSISVSGVSYEDALAGNPSIEKSVRKPMLYDKFWSLYPNEGISSVSISLAQMRPFLIMRIYRKLRNLAGKLIHKSKILR